MILKLTSSSQSTGFPRKRFIVTVILPGFLIRKIVDTDRQQTALRNRTENVTAFYQGITNTSLTTN